jgi:large subunit ribosomal protein L35
MGKSKNAISKTRKAVAKRFKVTATGKVVMNSNGKRHLSPSKNRKRMRRLGKAKTVAEVEQPKLKRNLPFA